MEILKIKESDIPIEIKNYSNSKSVKIYFKGNILNINKPTRLSKKRLLQILKEQEEEIYGKYKKILDSEIDSIKQWKTGEKIYYQGEEFTIIREFSKSNRISITLKPTDKMLIISVPEGIEQTIVKENVDKAIKKLFKNNTEVLIAQKLPYWSKITKIDYTSVKVKDAKTRYGSCIPSKKALHFSSRLIMLPEKAIDAVIVHELCHIIHPNHSKNFYELVEKYIPNYKEIDKYLKRNNKLIAF